MNQLLTMRKASMLFSDRGLSGRTSKRQQHRQIQALNNVSLDIREGDRVALIGRNGSGKSTLLKLMAGQLRATAGEVTYRDEVRLVSHHGLRFMNLPTLDNVALIIQGQERLGRSAAKLQTMELLRQLELDDRASAPLSALSSGMKARLSLALALRNPPPLMLIDELLAVTDRRFNQLAATLMANALQGARAMVLSGHSETQLRKFCTSGLVLHAGQVVAQGDLDNCYKVYNGLLNDEAS